MKILAQSLIVFLTLCGISSAQIYNQFSPGGDLAGAGSTWNSQVIANGAVTLQKQANLAGNSIQCNESSNSATPSACTPTAAAVLMSAAITVQVVATTNNTLTGLQTIDGQPMTSGQSVLVIGQTIGSQNGIYLVQSGAWIRDKNFPSGYVLPQNCDILFLIQRGTLFGRYWFRLDTSGGSLTIGTSNLVIGVIPEKLATATVAGVVVITEAGDKSVGLASGAVVNQFDCPDYNDVSTGLSGSIADDGNAAFVTGPCVTSDPIGHPHFALITAPTVSGAGCSAVAGSQDNTGAIVATGIDTCTVAFGGVFTTAPFCTVSGYSATVLPTISSAPTTLHAIFATAAAGTFSYHCL